MRSRWRHRLEGDDGAAAVEFALVCMVLVAILLGIVQFGLTFSQWLEVVHSAREGVRWASLRESESVVRERVIAAAGGITPKKIDIEPGNYTDPSQVGQPVTVTVYYDSAILAPYMEAIFNASGFKELRSSATQRVE